MGGGKGGKKGGGGYPWWQHIKSKGGGGQSSGGSYSPPERGGETESNGRPMKQAKLIDIPTLTSPKTELQKYCWNNLEGAGYGAYKDLKGEWKEDDFTVFVDHVQGDAYAPPSHVRVRIPMSLAGHPAPFHTDATKNRAATDFMQRVLNDYLRGGYGVDFTQAAVGGGGWSSSKGGDIQVDRPSQFVLQRSCVVLTKEYIEARATLALPAHGRTAEGKKAAGALDALVKTAQKALIFANLDHAALKKHINGVLDQQFLREWCRSNGLVAFVGNGAILPRKSGNDDRPMQSSSVVPFVSPASVSMCVTLPHGGEIQGMAIRRGITLIVGGGFHGKSTLLQALQTGVYDAIPADGRELVVTDEMAFKVRSEDGRPVLSTDISPFIRDLPFDVDTTRFSTQDASGSTSQAANISEALEAGCKCLLVDEDTCATNFMIRDQRMQMLVATEKEPIQPFIDKVLPLWDSRSVSTILVVGASGDFFQVADTVLCMEDYRPKDVTTEAKAIVEKTKTNKGGVEPSKSGIFPVLRGRKLKLAGGDNGCVASGKASARSLRCIEYGDEEVELTYVEQLVELSQAKALCDILQYLGDYKTMKILRSKIDEEQSSTSSGNASKSDSKSEFRHLLDVLDVLLDRAPDGSCGLDNLSRFSGPQGFYSKPRKLEIACAINRLRTAKFS
ncbi:unnamed protein product [Amoebophrya sp. A25]|nr:unnamed protein product [Amoebophrya sp. A25]|eukprot:GSA25T00025793001.1